jgi:hypothetical protein
MWLITAAAIFIVVAFLEDIGDSIKSLLDSAREASAVR